MTLTELAELCHRNARSKGFWDRGKNIGEELMLITSELSEALEADRSDRHANIDSYRFSIESGIDSVRAFDMHIKDTFEDELADATIRIMDLAVGFGIDLEKHIRLKMEYNAQRQRLHGKRY